MHGSIVLIGMPGCGKSTLGVVAAKYLGLDFIDCDILIQRERGETLASLIARLGVEAFLDVEGAFTHQEKRVLFVVVTLTQVARVKRVADHYDPQAFMIVMDANEVMGRGFTMPGVKLEKMLRERDRREGRGQVDE